MLGFNHLSRWIMGATAKKRHKDNMAEFNRDFDINAAQDRAKVPEQIQALRNKAVTPWWQKEEDNNASDYENIVTSLNIIYERINEHELAVRDLKNVEVAIDLCNKYEKEHTRTRYTWTGQRRLDWVRTVKWRLVLMLAQECEHKINVTREYLSEKTLKVHNTPSYVTGVVEFVKGCMEVIQREEACSEKADNVLRSLNQFMRFAFPPEDIDLDTIKSQLKDISNQLINIKNIAETELGIKLSTAPQELEDVHTMMLEQEEYIEDD